MADRDMLAASYLASSCPPGRTSSWRSPTPACGMDEATPARIFEPFFTTKFTGRGLGLAAVLGIVRAPQGRHLRAERPGTGTTFRVLFRRHQRGRAAGRTGAVLAVRLRLFLLVDDEDTVHRLARRVLERGASGASRPPTARRRCARWGEQGRRCARSTGPRDAGLSSKSDAAASPAGQPRLPVIVWNGYIPEE